MLATGGEVVSIHSCQNRIEIKQVMVDILTRPWAEGF